MTGDVLTIAPTLPQHWRSLSYRAGWKGRVLEVRIVPGSVSVNLISGDAMDVRIAGAARKLSPEAGVLVGDPTHHPPPPSASAKSAPRDATASLQ